MALMLEKNVSRETFFYFGALKDIPIPYFRKINCFTLARLDAQGASGG